MAAQHTIEDEVVETPWPPFLEPTPEASGICGQCYGDGKETEYHERTGKLIGYNVCGNCGGDGKSKRIGKYEETN